MATTDLKSFYYLENGEIAFSLFDTVKSSKQLDSGSYVISYLGYPDNKVLLKLDRDSESVKIHNFPDKQKIDDLFASFFEDRVVKKMKSLGFYHKVGILLHGKEGTGKSTILKYYYNKAISEKNAIVFQINCRNEWISHIWDFIISIREIQNNPIIIIFEEFDGQIQCNEGF